MSHIPKFIVIFFNAAVKINFKLLFRPRNLPYAAVRQPVIRHFNLLAVHNSLSEKAVIIPYAAAHSRQGKSRKGLHKAGCKAPQAAVAQAGIGLHLR